MTAGLVRVADRVRLGPSIEDRRQGIHEAHESEVGLQITGDIGDDLVTRRQLEFAVGQAELRSRVRRDRAGIDTLMHHPQHRVVAFWVEGLLPPRRTLPEIGCLETEEITQVLGPYPRGGVQLLGLARLELHVCAFGAIEELEVTDERRGRKDVLQIPDLQPLWPAITSGVKPDPFQCQGNAGDFLSVQDTSFRFANVVMRLRRRRALGFIDDLLDARHISIVGPGAKTISLPLAAPR